MTIPNESVGRPRLALRDRIAQWIRSEALAAGDRLNEQKLAESLGVSRTPIRAALDELEAQGYVERRRNKGVALLLPPPVSDPDDTAPAEEDQLLTRIAHDRQRRALADEVSERDLMETYGETRATIKQALVRLADLGIVERRLGYRWKFQDAVWYSEARVESYRFRLVIEPAAILEPTFQLAPEWAAHMRIQHSAFLTQPWTEASAVAFFETNAAFHEGLAIASGNRFYVDAIRRLNRMRRLSNYDWKHGRERMEVSCHEHLGILAALESGNREGAAELMRRHLDVASRLRSPAPGESGQQAPTSAEGGV
ncbi:DNA-binding transcriptional regulator, GntR family [Cupriavidus sp. YR651]|uniref:GntR family transcriptional regulator n=1 Tax=Cupriavidus sp. YR651 TaxID=1855315 RepID=UPI0008878DA9|nr:GntR family transcriptional regulator [Cupriavidus sp. YR651]SDB98058.1 DNA-binding transcriptional regulator, GntR family [Cupriavidus sp. YR651]